MPRKSLCWDTYTSEVVVLDSSDDDEVPVRTRKGRIGARKQLISSPECSPDDLATSRLKTSKFRIRSDSSSDDCVVYSSDEEQKLDSVVSRVKELTLPKFSYETPDKKTSQINRKLLSDISNRCGTPLKSLLDGTNCEKKLQKGRSSKEQRNSRELKPDDRVARNNRLFDALLKVNSDEKPASGDISSFKGSDGTTSEKKPPVKVNDSYSNAFLAFHDIMQSKSNLDDAKGGLKDLDKFCSASVPEIPKFSNDSFKKPSTFKKQKDISNRVKRPGDSKIVSRRTDDSDSTDCATDGQQNSTPRKTMREVKDLVTSLGPSIKHTSPDPLDTAEPVFIPSDSDDFYVKESPKPPIKKKGKATSYCFSDLKTALEDIQAQGRDQLSFLSSLDCSVTHKSCHPTAEFYKEKFTKRKKSWPQFSSRCSMNLFSILNSQRTCSWNGVDG
uniref:Xanthine dehydrogenase/oxidase n=1 Tax=Lygus hesperus TaxID=30085 RepID=A0A0A9WWM3_LYGHE